MTLSFRMTILMISMLFSQMLSACVPQQSVAPTSAAQPSASSTIAQVSMPNTEVRQLNSSATGRDYDIYVRLPDQYAQDKAKKYPVLYLLHGQWDFKMLDSIQSGLLYDKFVPEMIIVG